MKEAKGREEITSQTDVQTDCELISSTHFRTVHFNQRSLSHMMNNRH